MLRSRVLQVLQRVQKIHKTKLTLPFSMDDEKTTVTGDMCTPERFNQKSIVHLIFPKKL